MRLKSILAIGLCGMALLAYAGTAHAGPDGAGARPRPHRKGPPLQVDIHGRRAGGYSYGIADVTGRQSPPPYAPVLQSPGGPFDSGFFFDSGMAPHGGNSPYLH